MKVRAATIEDAMGIAKVHVDTWRSTYKNIIPQSFLDNLSYESRSNLWKSTIPDGNVFVAENEAGEIIGFSSGGKERSGEFADFKGELSSIYILEEYQGRRIGKQLVSPVIQLIKNLGMNSMLVCVLEDNPSKSFYEKLGGSLVKSVEIEFADKKLVERMYGWSDLKHFS